MRAWSPVGLGLSCVLAAFGLCLRADNRLLAAYGLEGVAGLFACSFVIGAVLLCMVVSVSAHDEERRRWSIGFGLATGMIGVLFSLLVNVLPIAVSAAGAGLFLGFGLTCLLRQWGRYYRLFTYSGALLNVALSFLVASCWWFAMEFAGTPFLFSLGLLALVVCGGLPLLAREIVHADEVRSGLSEAEVQPRVKYTMGQIMREGWAAVVGIMLNFFMLGLTFWLSASELSGAAVIPKPLSYAVLLVIVALIVSRARRPLGGVLETFYRVGLPLAAIVLLVPLAGLGGTSVSLAVLTASYTGAALFNIMGLVVLFWMAKSSEVGFSKVFAVFCASCATSVFAGMAVFQLWDAAGRMVVVGLLMLYLVAVVLDDIRAAIERRHRTLGNADQTVVDEAEEMDERVPSA